MVVYGQRDEKPRRGPREKPQLRKTLDFEDFEDADLSVLDVGFTFLLASVATVRATARGRRPGGGAAAASRGRRPPSSPACWPSSRSF